ncbi:helix-turn-helix domain-containing protein [Thermotalea metallivorans]|uniref:HTH-type transcriptional regulator PuuR n=1 Tax=Thermotalea metallivorans TaxID=520762 RepID=A0A140L8F9_9FIRM|nr:XRE family transcriptional regulator [Thermotalea metallivorans]KXG76834.1 HTH-type transcriptional regulator PuuR [Thermotalea metallivorans]
MKIGEKLKRLRILNELTQDELAQRCDLTKGFISQIERDLTSPSIATLIDILEALGTDIKNFFNEELEDKIVFTEEDIYSSENEDLGYKISWLIPNAQKNIMEPILITLNPHSTSNIESPHKGEEFGYVLKGNINVCVGKNKFKVKKGESFYFKSNKTHFLENPYHKPATILWVASPPSF